MVPTTASSTAIHQDRGRHLEEEHLQLRHQPREHADPEVEQDAESDERGGELNGEREAPPNGLDRERRRIAGARDTGRRQEGVAVADRRDREMMQVEGENQGQTEKGQEVADRRLLAAHRRVDRHGEGKPELLGHDVAGGLQRGDDHADAEPEHEADGKFAGKKRERRLRRGARRQERPGQREQHDAEEERETEPQPRRDHPLADAGHEHDERADPGKGQHEGGR